MAADASAAVGFRARTCGIVDSSSLSIARPAGTIAGDVLVATFASENGAITPPGGWTVVSGLSGSVTDGQVATTWYRIAGGSEPANYTFTAGGANALAGSIAAFTGVSQTTPVNAGAAQSIVGSAQSSAALPNATAASVGSMRYSAALSDDNATTTSFQAPMTGMCSDATTQSSDVALGTAREPVGAGLTANRTVSLSDDGRMVLHTLVLNPACSGGALSLSAPPTVTFPGVTLSGTDQTVANVSPFDVTDDTGASAGWSISATSTTFTTGPRNLPTNATRVTGASAVGNLGTCSAPSNLASYPVVLPAAAVAPPAVKVYRADTASGRGTHDVDIAHSLMIPSSASTGTYTSTWTWTIASGP